MKLLFVHDTKFKEDTKGNLYTGGSFNEEVWSRYKSISSEFSVLARKDSHQYSTDFSIHTFNFFNKKETSFIEVPNTQSSSKAFFNIKKRIELEASIRKEVIKNDFIIARLPSINGNMAVKYAKKFNKPYLVEVVGCAKDSLWNYNYKGKLLAGVSYLSQKRAIKHAPYAIYVTNNFLQKRYPTRGKSVNCSNVSLTSFDIDILNKRVSKISCMKSKDKIIIGTTAAIDVRYKGQASIIKSIANLKQEGITNFEYQLVGGGDPAYLRSIAVKYNVEEQVKFLGSLSHDKVITWLDTIDIYAQPSKTEGLPRALIEAMSRGLPSIGTNVGGIPELIEEKYTFKNKKNNSKEISKIIKNMEVSDLLVQAEHNYNISKDYDKNSIENRRKAFLKKFVSGQ